MADDSRGQTKGIKSLACIDGKAPVGLQGYLFRKEFPVDTKIGNFAFRTGQTRLRDFRQHRNELPRHPDS